MGKSLAVRDPIHRVSLGEIVHQRMIAAFLSGQFRGGEELSEAALAAQFQVSRTPVREALRRLEAEGLVVNVVNRQATVIEPTRTDVVEAYEMRQILEASAARRAAAQLTNKQIRELRVLARRALPVTPEEWGDDERKFDETLHRLVAESCGNERLHKEIIRYSNLVRFVRARVARSPQRLAQGHAEHIRIVDALEARDGPRAEGEMAAHISSALQFVLEDLPLR